MDNKKDENTQWDERMELWIYYFHRWEEYMDQYHQSTPKKKAPINTRLSWKKTPEKTQHWKKHSRKKRNSGTAAPPGKE